MKKSSSRLMREEGRWVIYIGISLVLTL
jgi:hypothetical protein